MQLTDVNSPLQRQRPTQTSSDEVQKLQRLVSELRGTVQVVINERDQALASVAPLQQRVDELTAMLRSDISSHEPTDAEKKLADDLYAEIERRTAEAIAASAAAAVPPEDDEAT